MRQYVPTKHRKAAQQKFIKEAAPQFVTLFAARPTVTKLPTLREASLRDLLTELSRRNCACLYIGTRVLEGNKMVTDHCQKGPIENLIAMHQRAQYYINKKISDENDATDGGIGCPVCAEE